MKTMGIEINLDLAEDEADALAEMAKRICWVDIKTLSADDREATAMLGGINVLRKALAASGFAPR
jgi:hypothetical protein